MLLSHPATCPATECLSIGLLCKARSFIMTVLVKPSGLNWPETNKCCASSCMEVISLDGVVTSWELWRPREIFWMSSGVIERLRSRAFIIVVAGRCAVLLLVRAWDVMFEMRDECSRSCTWCFAQQRKRLWPWHKSEIFEMRTLTEIYCLFT